MAGLKLVSGPYTTRQLLDNVRKVEDSIADELRFRGPTTDEVQQRDMNNRLCDVSEGKNVVLYNTAGYPSIMVHIKASILKELNSAWTEKFHPAFIRNGAAIPQMYIGKYQAMTVVDGGTTYAISMRCRDPKASVTFDQARQYCAANNAAGKTEWHLMTNAEWAFMALLCKANGYWPRGNNTYGKDLQRQDEWGEPTYFSSADNRTGRVATGTGPKDSAAWSHDGTPFGVWDLNGNVSEWVGGLRTVNGEIQILKENDAADPTKDQGLASAEWKAILQDGTLVAPGTALSLKYDATGATGSGHAKVNTELTSVSDGATNTSGAFQTVTAAVGITIPDILKQLSLYPVDSDHGGDGIYTRNAGERMACRGGDWTGGGLAGVNSLQMTLSRGDSITRFGFRAGFVPVES